MWTSLIFLAAAAIIAWPICRFFSLSKFAGIAFALLISVGFQLAVAYVFDYPPRDYIGHPLPLDRSKAALWEAVTILAVAFALLAYRDHRGRKKEKFQSSVPTRGNRT
jgi:hypothetical protein